MADIEIPDGVIEAQRAYDAADAHVQEVAATLPSSIDIAAKEAELSDEQRQAWEDARAERLRLLAELRDLPWWGEVPDRLAAERQLRKAARSGA
jgi:predicted phage gp36 major capsid-like protein